MSPAVDAMYNNLYTYIYIFKQNCKTPPIEKKLTHKVPGILQVPTTQLAKMTIDPKFVELTADVLEIFL